MDIKKRPLRNLDLTKIDRPEMQHMLNEHMSRIEQALSDLAIAVGSVVGHDKLAAALSARITEREREAPSTGEPLIDAVWRAASQRAGRGPQSRTEAGR